MDPIRNENPTDPPANPVSNGAGPSGLKQIRTFEGDMAEAIERQNESIVSIQRAAEKKRGPESAEPKAEDHRALTYAVLTLVLAALGATGLYFAYTSYKEKTAPVAVATPENQFVSAVSTAYIDASTLSRLATLGAVAIERGKPRGEGDVSHIQMRRGADASAALLTPADLFTRLNTHAPQPLIRSFGELFMLGILGSAPAQTFLIIEIDSFQNAFAGMLEWEERLAEDMLPLFTEENLTLDGWSDLILDNRDTRVFRDASGKTALVYAFYGSNMLIITESEEALRTLTARLDSQRLSR